jgi:phosphatidylserine/phosphatidylglycerophosphate/cardiolipin synthase-like enzyme
MRVAYAAIVVIALLVVGVGGYLEGVAVGQGSADTSNPSTSQVQTTNSSAITDYSVCFSPAGNCASIVLGLINGANSSIHMMIYEFSNTQLANALVAAKDRGVSVEIVMDESEAVNDNLAVVSILNQGAVPLRIYSPPDGIVHDKVAIIDDRLVITGSYNWSYSANDDNDENLLVLYSSSLASQYGADFQTLWNLAGNGTTATG